MATPDRLFRTPIVMTIQETAMNYDLASTLWTEAADEGKSWFQELRLTHRQQVGGSCVSTGLSLLTGEEPVHVRQQINTQDPVSWSRYLQRHGFKLAYCPTDFRRLAHYVDELLALDDLFTLSTYSPGNPLEIGAEPDDDGWVCGSHFVLLHRDTVYDTRYRTAVRLEDYVDTNRYIKRLFRVLPANHQRGL